MKKIPVGKGKYAIVDDVDFKNISMLTSHKWHINAYGYAVRNQKYKNSRKCYAIFMHRIILNADKGSMVDHINHNTLDNRRENIRICTRSENFANRLKKVNCTSRHKGVWKCVSRWHAYIKKEGKRFFLGSFITEKEAALAYNNAAEKMFGNFALLNVI